MTACAVGFDFDHTLGFDQGLERRAFGLLAERLGAPLDVEEPTRRAALEASMEPFRRAEEPMEAMLVRFVASLPLRARIGERDARALAQSYREICYALVDELVVPVDGAPECIAQLVAGGIPVGILTNGWSPLQEKKVARALGIFPGPVLVSDLIDAYKPSAVAFHKLEGALGCSGDGLWYVGDNPRIDISGAQTHGVRAVWFDREGEPYPADLAPPDARIERLADLFEIVRGA